MHLHNVFWKHKHVKFTLAIHFENPIIIIFLNSKNYSFTQYQNNVKKYIECLLANLQIKSDSPTKLLNLTSLSRSRCNKQN